MRQPRQDGMAGAGLDVRPDPYLDYARIYTDDGGIRFIYKDVDERFRWRAAKFAIWFVGTAITFWFALRVAPLQPTFWNIVAAGLMALAYAWLVSGPIELYRTIEIKPDCMVIEDEDVFWCSQMDMGFPQFLPGPEGTKVLSGVYGTRWVEFLKVRSFDELDRTPAVFAAQLSTAMSQLWSAPGR